MRKVILQVASGREYDRGILRGIVEYARIHGPWVFYEEPPYYLKTPPPEQRLARMRNWTADGIITPQDRATELRKLKLPTVIICSVSHLPPQVPQIRADNESIGRMAADYLLGLGLKQLAYCGLADIDFATRRALGFRQQARQQGINTYVYTPVKLGPGESWYIEEDRIGTWLEQLPKPVGMLACNDDRARLVAEICRMRDIRVPDDIAILGVDNDEHVCNRATPALSSVALATERAGYAAAELLDQLISGKRPNDPIIHTKPANVVPRQSTDLIASPDPNLIKAIRYIREHANRIIHVSDVVTASGLSRRALQNRFRMEMNRTVLEAINQARIDNIRRLLVETNLPIGAIASASGYESDAHLARFFAHITGTTPTAFRRHHHKK